MQIHNGSLAVRFSYDGKMTRKEERESLSRLADTYRQWNENYRQTGRPFDVIRKNEKKGIVDIIGNVPKGELRSFEAPPFSVELSTEAQQVLKNKALEELPESETRFTPVTEGTEYTPVTEIRSEHFLWTEEAGIVDSDGDGVRELNGEPIFLRYCSYENRLLNDFSDAHTMYLAEIGIGVNSDYGSSDDCWNHLVAGEYDLDNNNWITVGTGLPTEYMANWYGKSSSNYCGYQSDEYDALYEQFLATSDAATQADLLQQMQQVLVNDAVVLVDGYYNSSMIYSKNVGYAHIHTADYYWLTTEIVPAA